MKGVFMSEPDGFKVLGIIDGINLENVAGMKKFDDNRDLENSAGWLRAQGFKTIISIEAEGTDETQSVANLRDIEWRGTFLADWHAPSVDHLSAYCALVDERLAAGKVVTHCWGGLGRTGVFLAAYIIHCSNGQSNYKAEQALKAIRTAYNPHAVELRNQYRVLGRFADSIGHEPSKRYETLSPEDHANGHFVDDEIGDDPGHAGTGLTLAAAQRMGTDSIMSNRHGQVGNSSPPYVGDDPSTLGIQDLE